MTARTGMVNLIRRLRGLTHAGTADYSVAGTDWWTDDQLQEVLDACRVDLNHVPLSEAPEYSGGVQVFRMFYTGYPNLEEMDSGTDAFDIENGRGDSVGTALYTADYIRGVVNFTSSYNGTALYITGRSYDLNIAAAQVWREKAAWRANFINFSADDQSFTQAQWFAHCQEMAGLYEAASGVSSAQLYRSDLR
ncbi:MAG: hypothetical protein IT323_22695 [Anaerolineae bacterium]|nr:hypothetical protein [Anaerolineae bacterium]